MESDIEFHDLSTEEWNHARSFFHIQNQFTAKRNFFTTPRNILLRRNAVMLMFYIWQSIPLHDTFIPYLAMNYFDRFLSNQAKTLEDVEGRNDTEKVQLIVIACLTISAKLRTKDFSVEQFLRDSNLRVTPKMVMKMELDILHAIRWIIQPVTALTFLNFYSTYFKQFGGFKRRCITEIVVQAQGEVDFVHYMPTMIASCAFLAASRLAYPTEYKQIAHPTALSKMGRKEQVEECAKKMFEFVVRKNIQIDIPKSVVRFTSSKVVAVPHKGTNDRKGKAVSFQEQTKDSKAKGIVFREPTKDSKAKGVVFREPTIDSKAKGIVFREPTKDSKAKGVVFREPTKDSKAKGVVFREPTKDSKAKAGVPQEQTRDSKAKGFVIQDQLRDSKAKAVVVPQEQTRDSKAKGLVIQDQLKDNKAKAVVVPQDKTKDSKGKAVVFQEQTKDSKSKAVVFQEQTIDSKTKEAVATKEIEAEKRNLDKGKEKAVDVTETCDDEANKDRVEAIIRQALEKGKAVEGEEPQPQIEGSISEIVELVAPKKLMIFELKWPTYAPSLEEKEETQTVNTSFPIQRTGNAPLLEKVEEEVEEEEEEEEEEKEEEEESQTVNTSSRKQRTVKKKNRSCNVG